MNSKIKKYYFLSIFISLFILTGSSVYAADVDMVDITLDPSGSFGPGSIISETNILPGDHFSRKITISNKSPDLRLVMLRFDSASYFDFNNGLESEIQVEIKKSDGNPVAFPFSSGMTLRNLYDEVEARNFDILGAGTSQPYEIFFTFDPSVTDQSKNKTKFDLTLGVESEIYNPSLTVTSATDGGGGGNDGGDGNGGGDGGNGGGGAAGIIPGIVRGVIGGFLGPQIAGEETQQQEGQGGPEQIGGGETKGAETVACQSWPKWTWIAGILAYAAVLLRYLSNNYKKELLVWKFAPAWTAAAVGSWYFGDRCREFQWFLYSSIIIAIGSYFIYLWMLKKKIKSGLPPGDQA